VAYGIFELDSAGRPARRLEDRESRIALGKLIAANMLMVDAVEPEEPEGIDREQADALAAGNNARLAAIQASGVRIGQDVMLTVMIGKLVEAALGERGSERRERYEIEVQNDIGTMLDRAEQEIRRAMLTQGVRLNGERPA
jgi:hypothetical protein